jgi:hypothetical protein
VNESLTMALLSARAAVGSLRGLGIVPPAQLVAALDAYDEAETWEPELFDLGVPAMTVDVDGIGELLTKAANARVLADAVRTVRVDLLDLLARRVVREHRGTADVIVESVRPTWDAAVADFTAAYRQLPNGWRDHATLVSAGASAVDAYHRAMLAASALDALRALRRDTGPATRGPVAAAAMFADVEDSVEGERLGVAVHAARGVLEPWATMLDHEGTTRLAWRTSAQLADYLARLPQARVVHERVETRGFVGVRPKKERVG